MKRNKISWGIVSLIFLGTLAVSFGPWTSHSQQDNNKPNPKGLELLEKYPVVNYAEPEPQNATEREVRREKSKRYDNKSFVIPNPRPDFLTSTIYDAEPVPTALPFKESKLVVMGDVVGSKAWMSNDKAAVYTEFTVQIETVLRQMMKGREFITGQHISVDRPGGRVHYDNGATILYLNDWQDLPELGEKYLFFLDGADGGKNPNFRIVTAYRLTGGKVTSLDHGPVFRDYNGRDKSEFLRAVRKRADENDK